MHSNCHSWPQFWNTLGSARWFGTIFIWSSIHSCGRKKICWRLIIVHHFLSCLFSFRLGAFSNQQATIRWWAIFDRIFFEHKISICSRHPFELFPQLMRIHGVYSMSKFRHNQPNWSTFSLFQYELELIKNAKCAHSTKKNKTYWNTAHSLSSEENKIFRLFIGGDSIYWITKF